MDRSAMDIWIIQTAILLFGGFVSMVLITRTINSNFRQLMQETGPEQSNEEELDSDEDFLARDLRKALRSDDPEELANIFETLKLKKQIVRSATLEREATGAMRADAKAGAPGVSIDALKYYRQALKLYNGLPLAIRAIADNFVKSKTGKSLSEIMSTADSFQQGLTLIQPILENVGKTTVSGHTSDISQPYAVPR